MNESSAEVKLCMSLLSRIDQTWLCECGKHSMPPVLLRIAHGAIRELPGILRELNFGSTGVVIEDTNTRSVAGATLVNDLNRSGFSVSEVIVERPDEDNVTIAESKLEPGNFLMGVGGTSVLDIAKLVDQILLGFLNEVR